MYEAIIIGAGLSGLAAGLRLSFYEKRVLIVEAHTVAGGLNSYYQRDERTIDVGLHAMTNFTATAERGAPLNKLLRSLRLKTAAWDLVEQIFSRIVFPTASLTFTNNFADFLHDVNKKFPASATALAQLVAEINAYNDTALTVAPQSTREKLRVLPDKMLREMLLCPLMYYGNAVAEDMDFTQFVTMWKAIFTGGFCRPRYGMKKLITALVEKYREQGGEIRFRARVQKIIADENTANAAGVKVVLTNGETIAARQIYSSAGAAETAQLCAAAPQQHLAASENHARLASLKNRGTLGFVELVLYFAQPPRGDAASIIFFNTDTEFIFRTPDDFIDSRSGVICCPHNFNYPPATAAEGCLRITALANYEKWAALSPNDYATQKKKCAEVLIAAAEKFYPQLRDKIIFTDFFTPLTIERYTGHYGGAIYGAPQKIRDGKTAYNNVYLIGTDQGFLGIVGSMLSGVTITNLYGLK